MGTTEQQINAFTAIVGEKHVHTDETWCGQHAVDGILPDAVILPGNDTELAAVVNTAQQAGVTMIPYGGGTKMAIGHLPRQVDVVIGTSRMNHILDVDVANLTITVEAGVRFSEIQARLAVEEDRCYLPITEETAEFVCSDRDHSGSFLPLDPPDCDRATIGGILATNTTGPRRLLYGTPRDLVLGLRFITVDGDIIGAGGKTVKNVSGYDVSKLMIGAFGSLGILSQATLRLLPMPEEMQTLIFGFDSLAKALSFTDHLHGTPLLPAAVEVFNSNGMAMIWPDELPGVDDGAYAVAVALEGFSEPVARMRNDIQALARDRGAMGSGLFKTDNHRQFWQHVSLMARTFNRRWPDALAVKCNYPLSRARAVATAIESTLGEAGHVLQIHSGSGTNRVWVPVSSKSADTAAERIEALTTACRPLDATLVVQQAPVKEKADLPIWGATRSDVVLFERLKQQADPNSLLNPGRFVSGL